MLPPRLPVWRLLERVVATAIVGNDQTYLEQPCVRRRTIQVDTSDLGIVEFDVAPEKRDVVIARGDETAKQFLSDWCWKSYKRDCLGIHEDG